MFVVRVVLRLKLVVVIKLGCYEESVFVVILYIGVFVGLDFVYDVVFWRVGIFCVLILEKLFDVVEMLLCGIYIVGECLVILMNGGGIGVLVIDCLFD